MFLFFTLYSLLFTMHSSIPYDSHIAYIKMLLPSISQHNAHLSKIGYKNTANQINQLKT